MGLKGEKNPAKCPEVRRKISEALRGREVTWGDKISKAQKGKTLSEERKQKIREGVLRFYKEHPEARKNPKLKTAEEAWVTRKRLYGSIGVRKPSEYKARLRERESSFKGKTHTLKAREKLRQAHIGVEASLKTRAKMSKSRLRFLDKHPEFHPNVIMAKKHEGMGMVSKPQLRLFKFLKRLYKDAKLEYPIKTRRRVRVADVAIPSKKIDFEYDEKYWHTRKKDLRRDKELLEVGWTTIRVKQKSLLP